ncbi:MAG TPA: ABC transporter permease [Desulfurococcales archaeon]|nr:ABC transporter permease [Desulfurococcales archaeon]
MKERVIAGLRDAGFSALALIVGLGVGAGLMLIYGYDPVRAYMALFTGSFGTVEQFAETLAFAVPLMLTGITFAIGVKAGLFNIGAEGQMYMGAIGAVIFGGLLKLPPGVHTVVAMFGAMLFGLLWSIGPALLKVYRGVHEVISTIMFNWMAYWFVMYLAKYVVVDPNKPERTITVYESARLPVLVRGASLTAAIYVSILFCIVVFLFLTLTRLGFELRLYGANPSAAHYAGVKVWRVVLASFIIGGLAAGLAGGLQIIGRPPTWALYATLGNVAGLGFEGIGVALIGRNNPIGVILASIFYGALQNGGRLMQYEAGVYAEFVRAISGLIIIALAVPEAVTLIRIHLMRKLRRWRVT